MGVGERAALYVRVSTEEQAKSGYSVPEQKRTLLECAEREGYRVVEVIVDDGYSGASLDRPGLRRVLELAEAGAVDVVVAVKRDRFFRRQLYRLSLDEDLKDMNVRLVALNDTGNKIGDSVLDSYAEWERDVIAERMVDGKNGKARSGQIVGQPVPPYGYRYVKEEDRTGRRRTVGMEVDPEQMPVVSRVFREAADGEPVRSIVSGLTRDGIKTQTGKPWSRAQVRKTVKRDLYRPHTVAELRALGVADVVLYGDGSKERPGLDPERSYGVSWHNEIAVPVEDAGVPRQLVEDARERLGRNRVPSKIAGRMWELGGGIMRCSVCGRAMQCHVSNRKGREPDSYYRCPKRHESGDCGNAKSFRADRVEPGVWDAVREAMGDGELLRDAKEKYLENERKRLRPPANAQALADRLEEIVAERKGTLRQNARGLIEDGECDGIVKALDTERTEIEESLSRASGATEALRQSERAISDLYDEIIERGGAKTVAHTPPHERTAHYRKIGLSVLAYPDGSLVMRWFGDQPLDVRNPHRDRQSWRRPEEARPPHGRAHPRDAGDMDEGQSRVPRRVRGLRPGVRVAEARPETMPAHIRRGRRGGLRPDRRIRRRMARQRPPARQARAHDPQTRREGRKKGSRHRLRGEGGEHRRIRRTRRRARTSLTRNDARERDDTKTPRVRGGGRSRFMRVRSASYSPPVPIPASRARMTAPARSETRSFAKMFET